MAVLLLVFIIVGLVSAIFVLNNAIQQLSDDVCPIPYQLSGRKPMASQTV